MRRRIICGVAIAALLMGVGARLSNAASQAAVDLDAIPQLRLVEELRIGSASDPSVGFTRIRCEVEPSGFARSGCVSIDRDGQIYVFEAQDRHIRVYRSTGQQVRTIGRSGTGPGEFQPASYPTQIGVQGDTVWAVEDNGLQVEISLFGRRDGALLSTSRSLRARTEGRVRDSLVHLPSHMRADGTFISGNYSRSVTNGALPSGPGPSDTLRVPRLLFNTQGKVIDTIAWRFETAALPTPAAQIVTTTGDMRRSVPRPTSDGEIAPVFSDGRFVVQRPAPRSAAQATFRVTREGVRGESIYTRSYRYRPVRYSADVLNQLAAASLTKLGPGVGGGRPLSAGAAASSQAAVDTTASSRAAIRQAMSFPDFQPPVHSVFIGVDASIWLRREEASGQTQRWLLLDPQGNPRGHVNLPKNVRPMWSSGDTLWGVQPDTDEVPWMVKFRISR